MSERKITILWPNDFSDTAAAAFPTALNIAKTYNAELVMLHVLEAPSGPARLFGSFDEAEARKKAHKMMDNFWSGNGDETVRISKVVKIGKPYRQIIDTAKELEINAIVMGTHGAEGLTEILVGSNAGKVIRSAPCPVITMRSKPENPNWKKILVPLDLTLETGEKIQLAMEFALNFGAEISLLTVVQNNEDETKKRLNKRAKLAIDRITSHKIPVESNMIQSKDDIAEVIVKYAEDSNCDLVVIMTQQEHKDLKEHLLGTHAEHVVNHSSVPVMSIKPKREYRTNIFAGSHFG